MPIPTVVPEATEFFDYGLVENTSADAHVVLPSKNKNRGNYSKGIIHESNPKLRRKRKHGIMLY